MVLRTKFSQKTHYETMGVKEDAKKSVKLFRMSVLNCHPDKHTQMTSETSNHKHGSGSEFLEDITFEDAGDSFEFSYHCRCGDCFLVNSLELEEMGYTFFRNDIKISSQTPGSLRASIILPCGSCSAKVGFYIDAEVTLQF
ncbi:uncharacterized protein [Primulina eburnea]|uniref:uncharacterized protein n=1 Tax=Primulina eburnea TaxID=1245227 RepID=UPI003C6C3308